MDTNIEHFTLLTLHVQGNKSNWKENGSTGWL